jgi:hypothetical protein
MKPEERDAVIANVTSELQRWIAAGYGRYGSTFELTRQDATAILAALTAQSPAGVPPEPFLLADAKSLMRWARMRVEDRVITQHDMDAVADMLGKLIAALAGVPTEPVAPIAREPERCTVSAWCRRTNGHTGNCKPDDAAPQAPAEPVAQGEVQPYLLHDGTNWERGDCVVRQAVEPVAQEPVAWIHPADLRDMRSGALAVTLCAQRQDGDVPLFTSPPVAQEPDAWMYKCCANDGEPEVAAAHARWPADLREGWIETPLYASPISLPVEGSKVTRG